MGSEGLFSELLVATGLEGIDLQSVGSTVDHVVLGEQVADGVHSASHSDGHDQNHLGVRDLGSGDEHEVLRDVMSHLRSGRRSSIVVLDHTVMELRRHGDNHVIVVRVEVSSLRDICTKRSLIVVAGEEVIRVVDHTGRVVQGLGQIWGPDTHVGVLSLMGSEIRRPHSIGDDSLSVVPLLEVITTILLMTRVDLRQKDHLVHKLSLLETLIDKQIVLLMHSSVAALASSLPDLEASSKGLRIVSSPGDFRRPVVVTVMKTNGVDLLFVTLDTMGCTDIISVDPSLSRLTSHERSGKTIKYGLEKF